MEKKIGTIDFLQARIKKKLAGNYLSSPSLPSSMMMLGVCFGLGPFTLARAVETTIRKSNLIIFEG